MAFPSIPAGSVNSIEASSVTTHNVLLPTTISSGKGIAILTAQGSDSTLTAPTGFTIVGQQINTGAYGLFIKVAAGTEGGTTVQYTSSVSGTSASRAFLIDNWGGSVTDLEINFFAPVSSGQPDSPSLTPSWGAEDTLWITSFTTGRDNRPVNTFPTNYSSNQFEGDSGGGGGGSVYAMASRNLNAATEDPGAFALFNATVYTAATIAIKPVIIGPSISSISPDPAATGVELTITGVNFEASQGTGGVEQEQGAIVVALTENSWAATEITADSATIESTQLKYGTQTLRVTNDSAEEGTRTFVANPATDNAFVDIVTPHTPQSERLISDPDLDGGEQIRYASVLFQGGSPTAFTVVVNDDATGAIDGTTPDGTYQIPFIVWDDGDQTWGTAADQTVIIGEVSSGVGLITPLTSSLTGPLTSDLTG